MTEFLLHMNNYTITETITAYQTYPYCLRLIYETHNHFIQKNIKNRSHITIHTFKNYFITIFSVFNFH